MKKLILRLASSEIPARLIFSAVLLALRISLALAAVRFPSFRDRLKEKDLTVQFRLKDGSAGRYFTLRSGRVASKGAVHSNPDVTLLFSDIRVALEMLIPPRTISP